MSLTAHWAFIFWYQQHLRNLPDVIDLSPARKNELASVANLLVMVGRRSSATSSRRPWPA